MKKLLALTLSLLMAFSTCLTISADDEKYFEVNGQQYSTLADALGAVSDNSETTIKLIKDYETDNDFNVESNKDIVLDLNGKNLSITRINCSGKLTIVDKDSGDDEGKINLKDTSHSGSDAHIKVNYGGTFVLESGGIINNCTSDALTIVANGGTYASNPAYSKVIINGGYITGKESCVGVAGYGATVDVNGGFLYVEKDAFRLANNATKSSINVTGGKFYKDISEYLTDEYKLIKSTYEQVEVYEVVTKDANEEATNTTSTSSTSNTSTKSYDAKDKNKDGVISCEEEMGNANWVWSESKNACVYKVTNTSTK